MFPTLNYLINYLFGTHISFNFPPTFGTLVAIAFLSAAWVLAKELKRKEALGLLKPVTRKVKVGEPATTADLIINGLLGFIIGFKIIGIFIDKDIFAANPQAYLLSSKGSLIGGLIAAAGGVYWKYYEKKKQKLAQPKEETILVHPFQLVGNITLVAAVCGIVGAKIFHQLEYWDEFVKNPVGSLTSTSGLTFYGGLIGGFLGVWWYVRRHKFPLIHVADAVAPGLILAYAVGRIGCMLSGDGDWGIINSAYRITDDRRYEIVAAENIQQDLMRPSTTAGAPLFSYYGTSMQEARYKYFPRPAALSFLPNWMFAFDFPHNVNEEGVAIPDCKGSYCNRLPLPVFPTAFYETLMGLLIFAGLWLSRKRLKLPGMIFFLYLVFNGIERYLIEQIRVNSVYHLGGIVITQAEIIALSLVVIGVTGLLVLPKIKNKIVRL